MAWNGLINVFRNTKTKGAPVNTDSNTASQTETTAATDRSDHLDVKVMVEPTPNPFAYKFIINREVKSEGNVTYDSALDCEGNPLAKDLFEINGVKQLYLFENVITVTFTPGTDMLMAEDAIIALIKEKIATHDPKFKTPEANKKPTIELTPEMQQINEILDRTVRPALQGDGGDLDLIRYKDNELIIAYVGACGTCPSSSMGTLMAIEGVLREEFDPDITVVPVS